MKALACGLVAALAVALVINDTMAAQRPGGRGGAQGTQQGGRGGRGGFGRGGFGGGFRGMSMFPLMIALDADKDGELSEKEINNAVAALKKLDKNGDKKLSGEELRPQFDRSSRGPGGGSSGFMQRLLDLDKNKDGKIQKSEVTDERMQRMIDRLDTNKDGAVDKEEIDAMRRRFEQDRSGGRSGGQGGNRPQQRSRRPDA